MTVRKKLIISNILMIVIPVILAMMFGTIAFQAYGDQYWDPLEEMYDDENGVYSAQSIVYAYKEELSKKEWLQFAEIENQDTDISIDRTKKMLELEKQLRELGYHFQIRISGEEVYSNLTADETAKIKDYFEKTYGQIESLTLSDEDGAVIKNTFDISGEECEIAAVCTSERTMEGQADSYLKKYILSFVTVFLIFVLLAVVFTNLCLSGWIAHMILKPLNMLKKGARQVAEGNLEIPLEYEKKDEFGEVCREFNEMRGRLKKSVELQIRYEQYRRELIVGISHDLRTPLTSIKGYVEGLQDGIANTEEKQIRYYRAIHTRAMDMEALVDSLSTFARLENKEYKYHLEKVNLNEYLKQVIREYSEEAKQKKAVILYEYLAEAQEALLDIQEMRRVFINLFENSIKYRIKESTTFRLTVYEQGSNFKILSADDGPGVPERELEEIFHTFYRGDESRTRPESGSGLGLAIVKRIVEGHHGKIRAYNENGLVMEMILPVRPTINKGGTGSEENTDRGR